MADVSYVRGLIFNLPDDMKTKVASFIVTFAELFLVP
jgi:hypothetical protein